MTIDIRQEAGYVIIDYNVITANRNWDSHVSLEFVGELQHF